MISVSAEVYTLFKIIFLLFHTAFFIYSRLGIWDFSLYSNSCRTYQKLAQGDIYSFNQEKVHFFSICLLPIHKTNVTIRKIMLTWISSIAFVTELTSIRLQNFWLPLSVVISRKLSTINEYLKIPTSFIDEG